MGNETEAGPSTVPLFKKRNNGRTKSSVGIRSFGTSNDEEEAEERRKDGEENLSKTIEEEAESENVSIDDLIALRSMRAKTMRGIDLERLNKGDLLLKKKKKKRKEEDSTKEMTQEEKWAEQMKKGGLVTRDALTSQTSSSAPKNSKHEEDQSSEDEDDEKDKSGIPRLIKQNNFQGETGTVDVDKHMMAYIEEEMRKKKLGQKADENVEAALKQVGNDAEDELFRIAEKYKSIQQSAKDAIALSKSKINSNSFSSQYSSAFQSLQSEQDDQDKAEGNVALSTSMLTGVPEVDLGMDIKMRNIEATEKARRALEEAQSKQKRIYKDFEQDSDFSSARFFRHTDRIKSDFESISSEGGISEERKSTNDEHGSHRKRQTATDDVALDRFKKRQRNQLKR